MVSPLSSVVGESETETTFFTPFCAMNSFTASSSVFSSFMVFSGRISIPKDLTLIATAHLLVGNAIFERYRRWRVVGFLNVPPVRLVASSLPPWYHLKSDVVILRCVTRGGKDMGETIRFG